LVAIEIRPFEGEEKIARVQLARVGLDRWVAEIDFVKLFDSHEKVSLKISN
jgi:hypothetical protein